MFFCFWSKLSSPSVRWAYRVLHFIYSKILHLGRYRWHPQRDEMFACSNHSDILDNQELVWHLCQTTCRSPNLWLQMRQKWPEHSCIMQWKFIHRNKQQTGIHRYKIYFLPHWKDCLEENCNWNSLGTWAAEMRTSRWVTKLWTHIAKALVTCANTTKKRRCNHWSIKGGPTGKVKEGSKSHLGNLVHLLEKGSHGGRCTDVNQALHVLHSLLVC